MSQLFENGTRPVFGSPLYFHKKASLNKAHLQILQLLLFQIPTSVLRLWNQKIMECYATQILAWGLILNCSPLSLFLLFFCSPALKKLACCCQRGTAKGQAFFKKGEQKVANIYMLCELSLLVNKNEGVEEQFPEVRENSLYEKLLNHLDKRELRGFGTTKYIIKNCGTTLERGRN